MSYADKQPGRERIAAIGMVALVQGGLIAAVLSGLAVSVIRKPADAPLQTYPVNEPTPPPPEPLKPQPQPRTAAQPLLTAPLPRVPIPNPQLTTPVAPSDQPPVEITPLPLGPVDVTPVPPAPAPAPTPASLARGASPRGSVGDWFPHDSYPAAALRAGAEGRVGVAVTVLPSGRVGGCEVVTSSGNDQLDQATCRLAIRNGRFQPAQDRAGQPTAARIVLPMVQWRLEG